MTSLPFTTLCIVSRNVYNRKYFEYTSSRFNGELESRRINDTAALIPSVSSVFFVWEGKLPPRAPVYFSFWWDKSSANHSIPEITPDVNISTWRHPTTICCLLRPQFEPSSYPIFKHAAASGHKINWQMKGILQEMMFFLSGFLSFRTSVVT